MYRRNKIVCYKSIAEQISGPCSVCGEVHTIEEMRSLPEVEEHAREVGSAIYRDKPLPDGPKDEDLIARYGYDHRAVFCKNCLKKLLVKTFVRDIEEAAEQVNA